MAETRTAAGVSKRCCGRVAVNVLLKEGYILEFF